MLRPILGLLAAVSLFWISPPAGATDPVCITDSAQTLDSNGNQTSVTLIGSAPCGFFARANTRFERIGGVETQITVGYMKNEPAPYKAIAVLFSGSDGQTGITPDPCFNASPPCNPAPVATAGNNFLVRSAQLFAEHGFKALTIGRPSPLPTGDTCGGVGECYSVYRLSPRHAVDIAAVVKQENPGNKAVFLVGTSRGALSAIAQNLMGAGSMVSSPVSLAPLTSNTAGIPNPCDASHTPYVGDCFYVELQPASVEAPVQIVEHAQDACFVSPPSRAAILKNDLVAAGVQTFFFQATGGFVLAGGDPCEAQSFHGYLGVENKIVQRIAKRMSLIRSSINSQFPGNHPPVAGDGNFSGSSPSSAPPMFDLAPLATDPDGDPLTFALVRPASARGVPLSLSGSTVIYDFAAAGLTGPTINDAFVYVADDGKGKKRFGVVRVTMTAP